MKQFIRALVTKMSRRETPVADEHSSNAVSVEDVLMPDIYAEEDVDTVQAIKILDPSSPDIDKSTGFNPYDTAVLQKK